jgi:hypothetical protein
MEFCQLWRFVFTVNLWAIHIFEISKWRGYCLYPYICIGCCSPMGFKWRSHFIRQRRVGHRCKLLYPFVGHCILSYQIAGASWGPWANNSWYIQYPLQLYTSLAICCERCNYRPSLVAYTSVMKHSFSTIFAGPFSYNVFSPSVAEPQDAVFF